MTPVRRVCRRGRPFLEISFPPVITTGFQVANPCLQTPFLLVIFLGPGPPLVTAALKKGEEFMLGTLIRFGVHRLAHFEAKSKSEWQIVKE